MITRPDLYDPKWKTDSGLVDAKIPVALDQDYDPYDQRGKFDNYSVKENQFLARGHLSPNGDFSKEDGENSFTYVTTNIAPHWQPFNMGNWVVVETAVQKYANQKGTTLYVFTGTGGRAMFNGKDIMLNNRVLTPKYYWKAVCDPKAKQSVIFVAENKPGEISADRVAGCKDKSQTRKLGVVYCYSLQDAGLVPDYADFMLPLFTDEKCKPRVRGTFLDKFINGLK
ncbi:uncharacterized protein LOC122963468 [Acropora millepora]|uniref:uncharacterized protein LOC122963468 n=1 Tax=Acropora millepora TaxID=45264 RepID=UPI001CF3D6FB|nr:uncharacterized protein LOC122963468 [Acropora millepora]